MTENRQNHGGFLSLWQLLRARESEKNRKVKHNLTIELSFTNRRHCRIGKRSPNL
jgi:hypothetical protein